MLIHHFGAETQGFQGPPDHNDQGKAKIPEKLHFLKETSFRGGSGFQNYSERRPGIPQCISLIKIIFLILLV